MRIRSEYIFRMDPMLGYDDIASMIMEKYGNFSCRFCYSPLVMDETNGSGTREFLCRKRLLPNLILKNLKLHWRGSDDIPPGSVR